VVSGLGIVISKVSFTDEAEATNLKLLALFSKLFHWFTLVVVPKPPFKVEINAESMVPEVILSMFAAQVLLARVISMIVTLVLILLSVKGNTTTGIAGGTDWSVLIVIVAEDPKTAAGNIDPSKSTIDKQASHFFPAL